MVTNFVYDNCLEDAHKLIGPFFKHAWQRTSACTKARTSLIFQRAFNESIYFL